MGGLAIFGGVAFALYPLAIAHANDYLEPRDVVGATGGLLLAYSVGATFGPLGAAAVMAMIGPHGLFVFTAVVGACMAAFTMWRCGCRPSVPLHLQGQYKPLPTTTPVMARLDPRCEPLHPTGPSPSRG
jgi:MFS family permease